PGAPAGRSGRTSTCRGCSGCRAAGRSSGFLARRRSTPTGSWPGSTPSRAGIAPWPGSTTPTTRTAPPGRRPVPLRRCWSRRSPTWASWPIRAPRWCAGLQPFGLEAPAEVDVDLAQVRPAGVGEGVRRVGRDDEHLAGPGVTLLVAHGEPALAL